MIYILDYKLENEYISKILNILNIEYKKLEIIDEELISKIETKEFEAMFLSISYFELLKKLYLKDFKKNKGIDFIYKSNKEYITDNIIYSGFKLFLENENINLDKKVVLILGSSKQSKIIYEVIKDMFNPTVYIASITEELDDKLRVGDRKIRKIEISNLNNVDLIINTTELGNINDINSCFLNEKDEINSKYVIDMTQNKHKTVLLRKYEMKDSIIYSGLLILIYQVAYALKVYKNMEIKKSKIYEIYEQLLKEE